MKIVPLNLSVLAIVFAVPSARMLSLGRSLSIASDDAGKFQHDVAKMVAVFTVLLACSGYPLFAAARSVVQ